MKMKTFSELKSQENLLYEELKQLYNNNANLTFSNRNKLIAAAIDEFKDYFINIRFEIGCFCPFPRKGGIRSTSLKN